MHLVRFEKGVSVAKVIELTKPGGGRVCNKEEGANECTYLFAEPY